MFLKIILEIKMNLEEIKKKIDLSKKATNGEKEPIRTAAFQVILFKLLELDNNINKENLKVGKSTDNKNKIDPLAEKNFNMQDGIDVNQLQHLKSLSSVSDRCLALLAYVSKNVKEHKSLTTNEIEIIFGEKFGLTAITSESISMALKRITRQYVSRKESLKTKNSKTKQYQYTILQKGLEYIETKITEIKPKIRD